MIASDGIAAKTVRKIGASFARTPRPRPYVERRLWLNSDRTACPRPSRGPS